MQEIISKNIDTKLIGMEDRIDNKFESLDSKIDQKFEEAKKYTDASILKLKTEIEHKLQDYSKK